MYEILNPSIMSRSEEFRKDHAREFAEFGDVKNCHELAERQRFSGYSCLPMDSMSPALKTTIIHQTYIFPSTSDCLRGLEPRCVMNLVHGLRLPFFRSHLTRRANFHGIYEKEVKSAATSEQRQRCCQTCSWGIPSSFLLI